jgi:hypothetical protein
MAWSVSTLRQALTIKKDDPGVQTELAEALSKLDGGADEARTAICFRRAIFDQSSRQRCLGSSSTPNELRTSWLT